MNIDGINYLGLDRVLKRGSGEIVAEADEQRMAGIGTVEQQIGICEEQYEYRTEKCPTRQGRYEEL